MTNIRAHCQLWWQFCLCYIL